MKSFLWSNQALTGLVIFLLSVFNNAHAATFSVSPVTAYLNAQHPITALTIKNQDSAPITVEARLFRWQQVDGKEQLTPAPELLVTPPIFKIPRSSIQIIRVGMRKPITSDLEESYRLVLKEIPPQAKPDFQGLNVVLRISMPVFVSKGPVSPEINWRAYHGENGKLWLDIRNTGSGHTKIHQITLQGGGQMNPHTIKNHIYVLRGDHVRLSTGVSAPKGQQLQLEADTSKGKIKAAVTVE
jgi:fimbrial chaperone protein